MSEGFVVLGDHFGNATNWAEDSDGEHHDREHSGKQPVKTAWGKPQNDASNAPSLTEIFAEEQKKSDEAKLKAPKQSGLYRVPKPGAAGGTSVPRPTDKYIELGGQANYQRTERVPQPLPTEPPYTAFVGNLAFNVNEEMLGEFFGELGIVSIKIIEDNGTPKGYAYIEFGDLAGLKKALAASGSEFQGRLLNMDVAKPARSTRSNYNTDSNREPRRFDSQGGGGGRYDTTWGPSANRPQQSSFGSYNNRYNNNRPPGDSPAGTGSGAGGAYRPPTGMDRPKFNPSGPRAPSAQTTELHDTMAKPKGSFENPFGNNQIDAKKQDELAKARLARELERENKEKEKKEEAFRNQQAQQPPPRKQNPWEAETKTASSWRNNPKPPINPVAPRRDDAKPKKQLVKDEDGFYTKVRNAPNREINQEDEQSPPPQQPPQQQQRSNASTKTKKTPNPNNVDDSNIFASLSELGDDSDANV